jgi:hypothetical protein
VQVFLQPDVLERLDTYCKARGIGRGKAISHLLDGVLPGSAPRPAGEPSAEPPSSFPRLSIDPSALKQDAIRLGVRLSDLLDFVRKHKLPTDRHLSAESIARFRLEQQLQQRVDAGRERQRRHYLTQLQAAATPERLQTLAAAIQRLELPSRNSAPCYVLDALSLVGIRKRERLGQGLWADLEALLDFTPEQPDEIGKKCMFWGAILRLPDLHGEPPIDSQGFLRWCLYDLTAGREQQATDNSLPDFQHEHTSSIQARTLLGLSTGMKLTRRGINAAYRAKAREHHPDAGGSEQQFRRLTAARNHLLQQTGS